MPTVELTTALGELGVPVTEIDVTTGAIPVNITVPAGIGRLIVHVTTGGTAGEEILNFPPAAGLSNTGLQVIAHLAVRTNAADTVKLTADGSDAWSPLTNGFGVPYTAVHIHVVNQAFAGVWCYDYWYSDSVLTDYSFTAVIDRTVPATVQAQASGQSVEIDGRSSGTIDVNGGDVLLGTGAGGGGTARDGLVIVSGSGLPGTDPHVVGALYAIAGVVKISAGP